MKEIITVLICLLICLSSFPLLRYDNIKVSSVSKKVSNIIKENKSDEEVFRIKSEDGKIKTYSATDYIIGVLCGEMSPLSEKEALKAQAVAAYTFALKRKQSATGRDYDLTDLPQNDQCFIEKSKLNDKWGENAEQYYNIIYNAVTEVKGQWLSFEGEPALTVYHAISPGKTVSCQDAWGKSLPYLKSVESPGDKLSPKLTTEVSLTYDEIAKKLEIEKSEINFDNIVLTDSGTVKSVKINEKTFSGEEIRKALSLKSTCFAAAKNETGYIFTVKGNGHGVGLSQTGAQYMAMQGNGYKEILLYYYKGCTLEKN